jgi:hypothetical protein
MAMIPGFSVQEATDLLGLCAFAETDGPQPPIPDPRNTWDIVFDSPVLGPFDNKWQLWRRKDKGAFAIALRGTVAAAGSIIEDLIALMIKAQGTLTVSGIGHSYRFAADQSAGVHLGFALATLLLLNDLANGMIARLRNQVPEGSDVFITGHSQGAAMATLLRSYFHYSGGAPQNCSFKTYVYAQPKPGNVHYAEDFESLFCDPAMAFRVTNTLDWVPEVPFTLQSPDDIDKPNPLSVVASPTLLITLVKKSLGEVRAMIEIHTRSHFQQMAVAVAQTKPAAAAAAGGPGALPAVPFVADFTASLDYVNAGTDFPLEGTPCAGAECHDALFEHHATTYYALLRSLATAPAGT